MRRLRLQTILNKTLILSLDVAKEEELISKKIYVDRR